MKKLKKQIMKELDNIPDIYESISPLVKKTSFENKKKSSTFRMSKKLVFASIFLVIGALCLINVISVNVYNNKVNKANYSLEYRKLNTFDNAKESLTYHKPLKKNIFEKISEFNISCTTASPDKSDYESPIENDASSYSTNVQVEGIDEPDCLKVYDDKVYYVANNELFFTTIKNGIVTFDNVYSIDRIYYNFNLLKTDDYLILFADSSKFSDNKCEISIFNNKNELVKQFSFNGRIVDSRLYNNTVYFVITERIVNLTEPVYYIDNLKTTKTYSEIGYCQGVYANSYIHLLSLNLDDLKYDIITDLGSNNYSAIYMTEQALYLASVNQYKTTILRYKIIDKKLVYDKACIFDGHVTNQWFLDEYEGRLRVAAIDRSSNDSQKINKVMVFDLSGNSSVMELVGYLDEGIGLPYQTIRSVRFIGNVVNIVTYESFDPLYKIELVDGTMPVIIDVLEAPGYSVYLHPFKLNGKNYLIGLGYTDGWEYKVSLYEDTEDGNVQIGEDYIISAYYVEAVVNHRAILQMNYQDTFIFGFGVTDVYDYNTQYTTQSGYLLFKINLESYNPLEVYQELLENEVNRTSIRMVYYKEYFYYFDNKEIKTYSVSADNALDESFALINNYSLQ